jgi:hypothetical protein
MFGLPVSTEREKPLHKSEFFSHFGIKGKDKSQFDAEVSKMVFVNHLSSDTIPAWTKDGRGFWVLRVELKTQEASAAMIALLASNIRQRLVIAFQRGDETQFAVSWKRLLKTAWTKTSDAALGLKGRDAEGAWLGMIAQIGGFEIDAALGRGELEASFERQLAERDGREKTLAEIAKLERMLRKEKQTRRINELYAQIRRLKAAVGI